MRSFYELAKALQGAKGAPPPRRRGLFRFRAEPRAPELHADAVRALLDQPLVGIAEIDQGGRFLLANRRFCQLLGRSERELAAAREQDLVQGEAGGAALSEVVESGQSVVVARAYERPDGSVLRARASLSPIQGPLGGSRRVLLVIHEEGEGASP